MPPAALRVVVSSLGRFHAFDLALQLRARGILARLYTGHPWWMLPPELKATARTLPWLFGATRWLGAGVPPALRRNLDYLSIVTFDRWAERRLEPCDVLVHLSSAGLAAAARAQRRGARIVCDRGSTHIAAQDELLREEHARHGIAYPGIDPRLVERECREYAQADLITVPSTFAARSFAERGVHMGKVRVLPYGVDLSAFHPVPKEDARFRVLFVGTCSLRKGIAYLLDAVRPLVRARRVEVWLVGSKSDEVRPILARHRDLFVDHGPQPRSRLSWYYSQASVLVLPSLEEGLALVQAQAMACRVPVIATTNTGAEDLFTDGVEGFIVPIRDPRVLQQRIESLVDDPIRRDAMAEAARQRVQALGGWRQYGERAVDLYTALAAGGGERDRRRACPDLATG